MLTKFLVPEYKEFMPFNNLDKSKDKERYISAANEYLDNYEWKQLSATQYMRFFKDGNRAAFEDEYFDKRSVLITLVIAEYMEKKGRYTDKIIDGIWSICEESTWVIPAHNNHYHGKKYSCNYNILANLEEEPYFIDLFSAETAACLSITYYLMKNVLDGVTPIFCSRIKSEVKKRVLNPYMESDDFHWMGIKEEYKKVNNWNPWINSNYLIALLLLEENEEKRKRGIEKVQKSLSVFINGYGLDGGCDEGPNYWTAAAASLFDALEILYDYSGGKISVFEEEIIKNMGRYIKYMNVGNEYFVNFADGNTKLSLDGGLIYRYGEKIRDDSLMTMGVSIDRAGKKKGIEKPKFMMYRYISDIITSAQMENANAVYKHEDCIFLDNLEVLILRENDTDGLCICAKGGNNNESHNHNDVGNFVIYYNSKPVIIDVGVETYTEKTFSDRRYEIWTMQSEYHNIPIINGCGQSAGMLYKANNTKFICENGKEELVMSLEEAYHKDTSLISFNRNIKFIRETGKTKTVIADSYKFNKENNNVQTVIMTCCPPVIEEDKIKLFNEYGDMVCLYYNSNSAVKESVSFEMISIEDEKLRGDWNHCVYRILIEQKICQTQGMNNLIFIS